MKGQKGISTKQTKAPLTEKKKTCKYVHNIPSGDSEVHTRCNNFWLHAYCKVLTKICVTTYGNKLLLLLAGAARFCITMGNYGFYNEAKTKKKI